MPTDRRLNSSRCSARRLRAAARGCHAARRIADGRRQLHRADSIVAAAAGGRRVLADLRPLPRQAVGRPLLVTSNDYQLRLFNGDTGVVVAGPDGGHARAVFRRDGVVEELAPSRLGEVQTVHAMSVHRSQGSQFKRVTLVLPPEGSPLLTRELVYTAITRAEEHVRIIGTRDALVAAVRTPIQRASGLQRR